MARTLFLRLNSTTDEAVWQLAEGGQLVGPMGRGDLVGAKHAAQGAHVIALVPAEEVFLTHTQLPGKNRKKLLTALPFAIEDQLVDSVEDLHFVLGSPIGENRYLAAAVEYSLMQKWCQALTAADIRVDALVPDVAVLSANNHSWTLVLEADRALVRGSTGMFACDHQTLPVMLSNLGQQAEANQAANVTVHDCSGTDHLSVLKPLLSGITFEQEECGQGVFSVFARQYEPKNSINLLQGAFSRKENISRHLKPWLPAAVMFGIWLGWQLVLNIGAYMDLRHRSDQLAKEIRVVYTRAFRNTKPPAPGYERAYMEKQLNELLKQQGKAAGSLQDILGKTAPVLKSAGGLDINGIQFSAGVLTLELTIKQASEIENLKERIQRQTDFKVTSQATTEKGITKVRLKISGDKI